LRRVLTLNAIAERTNWQRVFRTRGIAMQERPGNEDLFAVVQSSGDDGTAGVEGEFAAGDPQRVGWFRLYFDDDRWEWSPQVEKMHGYPPGSVTPTTEMVLAHKHPDDYRHIADTLDLIRQSRQAFSSRHRIVDVQGRVHHVVVVGDLLRDVAGTVVGTNGYYVDITPLEQERQDEVTAAVTVIAEARADIERTKGMLMLVYGMDEASAFELLKWRSQETNVKLRLLAAQVAADFIALTSSEPLPTRPCYDKLLMTAHLRVNADRESGDGTVAPPSADTG
jgi:PAS domain S-box-containing protein